MCTTLLDEQVMARRVIAPTYFYPEVTDGWANVVMAAMYINAVMVNPDSGPGAQKLQGFAAVAKQSQAAGMQVLGYIPSGYGTRDIADIISNLSSYRTWYEVDGFFIDEMYTAGEQQLPASFASCHISLAFCCFTFVHCNADTSKVQYYRQIHDAVKDSTVNECVSSKQLIFNPGQPFVPEEYMPLADTFLTFEGSAEAYQSFVPAYYTSNYAPSKFYHLVYRVSNATINATLSQFNSQHAEYLYITDLDQPNPYDALPAKSTWAQLLAYMASTSPVTSVSSSPITSK